jgi:hypothetical protein
MALPRPIREIPQFDVDHLCGYYRAAAAKGDPSMSQIQTLSIRDFAQIAKADLAFGDLTVLVGAQGTGKSLALQWLKAALDGKQIVNALKDAGQDAKKANERIDLIFGAGMGAAWREGSAVRFEDTEIAPENLARRGDGTGTVFYIPAQRAMLVSDGWAARFKDVTPGTPVVARLFSEYLFDRLNARDLLFPVPKLLKEGYRKAIDDAVFHSGKVMIVSDQLHTKRLRLEVEGGKLPFMTWTAGQREFTPLLLGLYDVLPRTQTRTRPGTDWVIVEEPEMGLHPQAITVFLLLVLELLWRGYRVALSTHSPHVLTAVWMMQRLKQHDASWKLVCKAFEMPTSKEFQKVAEAALEKSYLVHLFEFGDDGKVRARDISNLSPDAEDEGESGWGGLTGFSSRFGDVVRQAVNESGR